ncbi:MAG: redoxin domain-containing protein [Patescibacteria group bacterium]|nr:redoxin domain-containing protein [Patescibacteria group bacterium]
MDQQNYPHSPALINTRLPNRELDVYYDGQIEKRKLSDYAGKWLVLFFYPADFTFVCPTELEELAGMYLQFQKINAEILSVSTDTAYAHLAWHDSSPAIGKVEFPMAADHNGELSKYLGIYNPQDGTAFRSTFIIDPEGSIKATEVSDNSIGRSATELFRKLQAAQYVATHQGEACPANWIPGKKTLKPGTELVGKL